MYVVKEIYLGSHFPGKLKTCVFSEVNRPDVAEQHEDESDMP